MAKALKPGQKAPVSGLYEIIGPRGGDTNKEVTAVKGKPLPPQPRPGTTYKLAEKAKHKRPKST